MALFSFFNRPKPRGFGFIPRFYDEKKEALEIRKSKNSSEDQSDAELLKQRIKSGLKRRGGKVEKGYLSQRKRRSNVMLIVILIALILFSFLLLSKYLPTFVKYLE